MGLLVFIYKDDLGDCTNEGVSSERTQMVVENIDGPFTREGEPTLTLVKGNIPGTVKLIPTGTTRYTMHGGNFAYTSDSRFSRAVEAITGSPCYGPVPIHDRIE